MTGSSTYDKVVKYLVENQSRFYRLAYSYAQNEQDALDIVQNAMIKALEHYTEIRNIEFIKTWFYRVLVNESISYIKKTKREVVSELTEEQEGIYHEDFQEQGDLYDRINELPLDIQNLIKLKFYEDMTLKEIATITGLKENTVKAKLYRGLKRLKVTLKEETA